VAAQLWGHRLIRSSLGPLAHVALLLRAWKAVPRSRLARWFVAGHVLAGVAFWRRAHDRPLSTPERILAHLVLLQGVALGGLVRYLRGDRPGLWPKGERPPLAAAAAGR
jgi:hypothetical protein